MQEALNVKLAALPEETLVYCGHEYAIQVNRDISKALSTKSIVVEFLQNLSFGQAVEPENQDISSTLEEIKQLRSENKPSVPSTIAK